MLPQAADLLLNIHDTVSEERLVPDEADWLMKEAQSLIYKLAHYRRVLHDSAQIDHPGQGFNYYGPSPSAAPHAIVKRQTPSAKLRRASARVLRHVGALLAVLPR